MMKTWIFKDFLMLKTMAAIILACKPAGTGKITADVLGGFDPTLTPKCITLKQATLVEI